MAGKTDYFEDKINDALFGIAAFSIPSPAYVGLSTTTPNEDGTGVTEPAGADGYARVALDPSHTAGSSVGVIKNGSAAIEFAAASGAGWGTVTHVLLWDAAVGGNLIGFEALASSVAVAAGQTFRFDVDAFKITED